MKTGKEALESVLKAIDGAVSNNLSPNIIIMHPSFYSLIEDEYQMFNKLCGLNVRVDSLAPKESFYIVNKEDGNKDEVFRIIRSTFHSQSGLFLNKKQSERAAEYILKLRNE